MFSKILIANRGEIACRVHASCALLAIKTVAIYADADATAKHVQLCNEAVHIGPSNPKESYLRGEAIIAAAKACGAQAIHPGYGFLSENAGFAQACADAGLVFIGPPPAAIEAMGLKAQAKARMEAAGVPLVPGYHGSNQKAAFLRAQAARIGYPVLIKASAGGGGKGMRVVERDADFDAALASCQREAQSSFGNDAVLIEKYVKRPRHIEIQIFGDTQGNCVYLFERDCSVQRRHQKVLEEAPAPGLPDALRQQMGEAAVAAARAVGYVGAGTVEFIVEQRDDGSMAFFFMEMNTRLQVEHPVTEAITGVDLVEWQLRVACGEPLPLTQAQLRITGHAIEARICAENPDNNFLPATGTLQVYAKPPHSSFASSALRFDDGVRQGDAISPYYDSMVAKLIVHGSTRAEALARLDAALAQTHIVGLQTNVQFLRHVLASPSFAQAQLDTALITREHSLLFQREKLGLPLMVAAAVAHSLAQEAQLAGADPFSRRDHWSTHGTRMRRFAFEFHGERHEARLEVLHDGARMLSLNHSTGPLLWQQGADDASRFALQFLAFSERLNIYAFGHEMHVFSAMGASKIIAIDLLAHAAESASSSGKLSAPMPGKVVAFKVQAGDAVRAGQILAVMDAMKMEHSIAAPSDGTVGELLYAPGDQVAEGAPLLTLIPAAMKEAAA